MQKSMNKLMSLMKRGKPVSRFVVISGPRTGSNFLISLLDGHPEIRAGYELFNFAGEPEAKIVQILGDPYRYMTGFFKESRKQGKPVTGFKLIYGHGTAGHVRDFITSEFEGYPEESRERYLKKAEYIRRNIDLGHLEKSFRKVWDFILEGEGTRIIHLKRVNLLEVLYSYKIALFTDSWSSRYPSSIPPPEKIGLGYGECLEYFQARQAEMDEYDKLLYGRKVMEVTYEKLIQDQAAALDDIFRFLGVKPEPTRPGFEKQNTKSLDDAITNYEELKERFRGSPWEVFFSSTAQ